MEGINLEIMDEIPEQVTAEETEPPALGLIPLENIKLLISYDGTDYHGWQKQPGLRTIQGTIEEVVMRIIGERINLQAAGRTDAGVHALGQVANFRTSCRLDEEQLLRAINALLPSEIRILSVEKVPLDFHSRKSARSKTYRYRIKVSPVLSPFDYRYVLHYPYFLEIEAMQKAALLFAREDDFSAFSSSSYRNPVRKVFLSVLENTGDELVYTIEANGFLRHMVRTIVGTLMVVGRGRAKQEDIEKLFRGRERTLLSPTAPAKGLCLTSVNY